MIILLIPFKTKLSYTDSLFGQDLDGTLFHWMGPTMVPHKLLIRVSKNTPLLPSRTLLPVNTLPNTVLLLIFTRY